MELGLYYAWAAQAQEALVWQIQSVNSTNEQ